jgi:hypothetical protein
VTNASHFFLFLARRACSLYSSTVCSVSVRSITRYRANPDALFAETTELDKMRLLGRVGSSAQSALGRVECSSVAALAISSLLCLNLGTLPALADGGVCTNKNVCLGLPSAGVLCLTGPHVRPFPADGEVQVPANRPCQEGPLQVLAALATPPTTCKRAGADATPAVPPHSSPRHHAR